jgi:hypothetical protein
MVFLKVKLFKTFRFLQYALFEKKFIQPTLYVKVNQFVDGSRKLMIDLTYINRNVFDCWNLVVMFDYITINYTGF